MFCYQPNFFSQTEELTSALFASLVVSDAVTSRIRSYREQLPALGELKSRAAALKAAIEADPGAAENDTRAQQVKELQRQCRQITQLKSSLPVLMYQAAAFDETTSKSGKRGRWRRQQSVRLNGLFMLDVDHVEDPRQLFRSWCSPADPAAMTAESRRRFCADNAIVLAHVTPSGQGLRLVAVADPQTGNLADNQAALAARLGVEPDAACKDATRCSFCPQLDDILYIDKDQLFTYDNKDYDTRFGPQYRGGDSQPTAAPAPAPAGPAPQTPGAAAALNMEDGYHGTTWNDIAEAWLRRDGGHPKVGDRHQTLYRMACDLRYITDFCPQVLARALAQCTVGADIAAERGQQELDRIASDACAQRRHYTLPRRLQALLQDLGVQHDDAPQDGKPAAAPVDYAAWWRRLEPLLESSPVLREAVAPLPDNLKLAGVLVAGAMLGTYLTRCWWEHFDGKDYRLSFLVYIVGAAASGKSFVTELDRLIMAPMLAADRVGREWERQYKEDMKKRAASTKNAKADAPELQHPVIRYVPSTVSNAMLYRRLTDAIDPASSAPDGQQPLHLHCYTMEPELATALRAQQGSWAGKNDLELKSFHNEYAGVDYANEQSVNGIIQVNWNQVVTGTPESMSRKVKPAMVLDGLVTRLVLFPMPDADFQMIERRKAIRNHERESLLRSVGITLEQVKGELQAPRLVDFCYDYGKGLADEARLEQDHCLDYFRKRIPVIMVRYALVRIVLRQTDAARKGLPLNVEDDDLQFARLIGDWCLMAQMHLYGQMVMEAREREQALFTPRHRSTKVREAYAALPEQVTIETLVDRGVSSSPAVASNTLKRWEADGLVKREGKAYRKLYKEIPC